MLRSAIGALESIEQELLSESGFDGLFSTVAAEPVLELLLSLHPVGQLRST